MTVTIDFLLLTLAGLLTFIGIKVGSYYLLKVISGIAWWTVGIWWIYNPVGTDATNPVQVIALLVVFFAGIAMFFYPFWTGKFGANGQETGGRFRIPFMHTDEEEESLNERSAPTLRQRNAAYQARLDAASRGERRGR